MSTTPRAARTPAVIEALTAAHADEVLAIYQAGIDEGDATFETAAPVWAEFDAGKLPEHRFVALEPVNGDAQGPVNGAEAGGGSAFGPGSGSSRAAGWVRASGQGPGRALTSGRGPGPATGRGPATGQGPAPATGQVPTPGPAAAHDADPRPRRVLGWIAVAPVSPRPVYAGVVEHSVYVRPEARGRGVARALLEALIASTEAAGIWTIRAGIFPENTASIALHLRAGFRVVGTSERLGRHHGVWRDVRFLERRSPVVG